MAGAVELAWKPSIKDKMELASSQALISFAKKERLAEGIGSRFAMEACKDYSWSGRKFREFIFENVNHEDLVREDDLFCVPKELCPNRADFEKAISEVYRARGGATHTGREYPATARIGPSHLIPIKAVAAVVNRKPLFPPVAWFERVVNSAICGYLRSQLGTTDHHQGEVAG